MSERTQKKVNTRKPSENQISRYKPKKKRDVDLCWNQTNNDLTVIFYQRQIGCTCPGLAWKK
jgi:hypothetical protein